MTILRRNLDAGRVDLGEVTTGEMLPPVGPGTVLRQEFMEPYGLSQYALAKALKVPPIRISQILHGRRAITADTALRLGAFFGTTPQFWMNLQADHDLRCAERDIGAAIRAEVRPIRKRDAA